MLNQYLKELKYVKFYVFAVIAVITLSYSVYLFFDVATVSKLGDEDNFFEYMTAAYLFVASVFVFILAYGKKNYFYFALGLIFFFGAGEEISWGQRIIGFETPKALEEVNVQQEFSFHNIEIFNTHDFHQNSKKGLARLLEVNFLFRVFMMFFGIVLPFCVYHIKQISTITQKVRLPVPPLTIGIFFFINWIIFRVLHTTFISPENGVQYLDTASEIFEHLGAFIFLIISIYFYRERKRIILGRDIKDFI